MSTIEELLQQALKECGQPTKGSSCVIDLDDARCAYYATPQTVNDFEFGTEETWNAAIKAFNQQNPSWTISKRVLQAYEPQEKLPFNLRVCFTEKYTAQKRGIPRRSLR